MIHVRAFDPPWSADEGGGGKGANAKYELADVDGIAQAMRMSPAWHDSGPMLAFMWATVGALHTGDAFALANRLHLRICAGFVWVKIEEVTTVRIRNPDGSDEVADVDDNVFRPAPQLGIGQWTRCEHEHLLICRRGDVDVPLHADRQRSVIYAPRGEHSAKPEKAWAVIEATVRSSLRGEDPIDAIEMFARVRRPLWGAWGTLDGPFDTEGNRLPARLETAPVTEPWNPAGVDVVDDLPDPT